MKTITTFIAILAISLGSFAQVKDGKYLIDFKNSSIIWKGKKVTGQGHQGTVRVSSGVVEAKGAKLANAKLKVDMNGIACTDLPDAESNAKLLNHLRAEDFFSTAKFPDAQFEATSFDDKKDGNGNTHVVHGKLTIKGITQEVSFPAKVETTENEVKINGEMKFDRSKFDVRYGSETFFGSLGDNAIENDVTLIFNLTAKK
jgi:polyisoprenoid-binding protein YceI